MKPNKYSACLLAMLLLCSGCQSSDTGGETAESAAASSAETTQVSANASDYDLTFSARDLDVGYDESTATKVTLSGSSAQMSGEGAAVEGGIITITAAGTYVISGELTNGQLVVDAGDADKVQLVLENAFIHHETGSAVSIKNADKVFITLAEGSENNLSDGTGYESDTGDTTLPDGVVYSKADLTFNGNGSLTVEGNYKHGIVSKDDLVITGGTYHIQAAGQGLHGKDCVKIKDGSFTIETGTDGIQSDNAEDTGRGYIYLAGGTYQITAATDAIQAETLLQIDGGTFTLNTGGGSTNASSITDSNWGNWGNLDPRSNTADSSSEATEESSSEETESTSAKALKSGSLLQINGGTFSIDSSDDALHCNGNLTVSEGTFTICSGDDGVHADGSLVVDGGSLTIKQSYEGIEGASITVNGGEIDLTASDDGFNAAGGNDASSISGRPGANEFEANSNYFIRITGGEINVNAGGDGLDSNGDLLIDGGAAMIEGPTTSGNGALDYAGSAQITGGTLLAVGAAGMAQGMSDTSTQYSFLQNFESVISGGTVLSISDADGNEIFSATPAKEYQSIVFSSPDLAKDQSYTLTAGSSSLSVTLSAIANNSGGRMMGGMGGGKMDGERPNRGDQAMGSMPEGMTLPDGEPPAGSVPEEFAPPEGVNPGTLPDAETTESAISV